MKKLQRTVLRYVMPLHVDFVVPRSCATALLDFGNSPPGEKPRIDRAIGSFASPPFDGFATECTVLRVPLGVVLGSSFPYRLFLAKNLGPSC
jgi:hypothetical protein